ncbi:unnamed protein product [Cuscuta europaea]|uniref:Peptidase S59 domain-containing protein n=1 Tax=Cuscuta europaea TaxID=41803 RepID=A0A9P0YTV9_CUSEU|nr:unnamed protein product [Cuscuta europaea]
MSNFCFSPFSSASLSQTSNSSNLFAGNSTGLFGTTSSAQSPVSISPSFGGAFTQPYSTNNFGWGRGNVFGGNSTGVFGTTSAPSPSLPITSTCAGPPFSPFQSQPNANSPFPSVHSSNLFSPQTQTQNSGLTQFSSFASKPNANSSFATLQSNPFSAKPNASSPFPSTSSNSHSPFFSVQPNLFSSQNETNKGAWGFSQFPVQPSSNSSFPSVSPNPFSNQPQTAGFNGFKDCSSSQSNASSPFPTVHPNPFSAQNQSNRGVSGFAQSWNQPNANSPFTSVSSNPFCIQTQTSGLNGFVNCSSQTNANPSLSYLSNPFAPQAIPAPTPYSSTKMMDDGYCKSISAMPCYANKSHEELRLEAYQLQHKKDGKGALPQAEIGGSSLVPPANPTITNSFPAAVYSPFNPQPTSWNPVPQVDAQPVPSSLFSLQKPPFRSSSSPPLWSSTTPSVSTSVAPGWLTPTSATTQENTFASKFFSPVSDSSNSSLKFTPQSTLCRNCNGIKGQTSQPSSIEPSTQPSPNQPNPLCIQKTAGELAEAPYSTPQALQMTSIHPASIISVQYGISSLSVSDKAAPTGRRSSSLIVRHSSLSRSKMPTLRYNKDDNVSRVPFFTAGEGKSTGGAKMNFVIFPRENPRSWIHPPAKECSQSHSPKIFPDMEHTSITLCESGNVMVEMSTSASTSSLHIDTYIQDGKSTQVHPAKESQIDTCEAVNNKHDIDVDATMPTLRSENYYTEPTIQELTAKEKEEPGFCRSVQDFVIGRQGCGSIKFIGKTDVRGLDLDALVKFNHREVMVYMDDDSKKPEVGRGLNKPAEVTLLNLQCVDKKTGKVYRDGPLVDKYKNLLIRKSAEQGAEFVSYDPVKGEWKFKVKHF